MRLKQYLITIVFLLALAIAGYGGYYVYKHRQEAKGDRAVSSFLIENAATPGKASSDFAQEQMNVGDTANIKLSYNPKLLTAVSLRFVASDGQVAKTTSKTPVGIEGSITIPTKTDGLKADVYRLEVLDQDQQVVDYGVLTLTAKP
jgi:hypothetical protein